jgi:hypothetical protein
MQEVMGRVQTLPDRKLEALLTILSSEERDVYDDHTLIVETDLTEEEKVIIARGDKNFREHPEEYMNFSDFLEEQGITVNQANVDKLKIVYR